MKITKFATTSVLLVAAMAGAAGTAGADPLSVDVAPHLNYTAYQDGKSVVITTDAGTMTVVDGKFEIKAADGRVVAGSPLTVGVDDFQFPIEAKVSGRTATLTPHYDVAHATYHPVDLPFQDSAPWKTPYDREQAAWNRLKDTISTGATLGAITGAVVGGAAGCIAGALLVGTPGFVIVPVIGAIFGGLAGCVTGALVMAPVGALGGAILIGAPVAIAAAVQYFTTINAPFKAPAK